jgi:hypothetical protein
VTGGPWEPWPPNGMLRALSADLTMYVEPLDGEYLWSAREADFPLVVDEQPTLTAAMEAADLWASENGYPAVRVEVDP